MSARAKADSMYCEHERTRATCEECVHTDALADATRAPATRDEMYPFPEGGGIIQSDFVPETDEQAKAQPKRRRR